MSGGGGCSLPWWLSAPIYYTARGYEAVSKTGERFLLTPGNIEYLKMMNRKYKLGKKLRVKAGRHE
jgi:hypothetical protein